MSLPLSLGALVFTGLLLRHELRARREERKFAISAQASLVHIDGVAIEEQDEHFDLVYRLKNASDKPIFRARLEMYLEGERWETLDSPFVKVIEAGGSDDLRVRLPRDCHELLVFSAVVVFRDAAGYAWQKMGDTPPEECPRGAKEASLARLLLKWYVERPMLDLWIRITDRPKMNYRISKIKANLKKKVWDYDYGDHSIPAGIGEDVDRLRETLENWRKQ